MVRLTPTGSLGLPLTSTSTSRSASTAPPLAPIATPVLDPVLEPVLDPVIEAVEDLEELLMDWPAPIDGNAPAIAGSPWLEDAPPPDPEPEQASQT